jgi:hypothetical protein
MRRSSGEYLVVNCAERMARTVLADMLDRRNMRMRQLTGERSVVSEARDRTCVGGAGGRERPHRYRTVGSNFTPVVDLALAACGQQLQELILVDPLATQRGAFSRHLSRSSF